ncbi:MAG TPA: right-handed parallel beta-helix repeat-containing protein [Lysobacter sp.]
MIRHLALLVLFAVPWPAPAHAAESFANCTGFIDTLPASISTQGTWCLRRHLYTSMTSGAAITLLTDNVTLDCNDFRLSGFGAGAATDASGVEAGPVRRNATIRHCRIQGFRHGVQLEGAGHRVEDNRFDGNTDFGVRTTGEDHEIRRNVVNDTGGRPGNTAAWGIFVSGGANVLDNTVQGISPAGNMAGDRQPRGIYVNNGLAAGNRVSGLVHAGTGAALGIWVFDAIARDNVLLPPTGVGWGVYGSSESTSICQDNTIKGYAVAHSYCQASGNVVQP